MIAILLLALVSVYANPYAVPLDLSMRLNKIEAIVNRTLDIYNTYARTRDITVLTQIENYTFTEGTESLFHNLGSCSKQNGYHVFRHSVSSRPFNWELQLIPELIRKHDVIKIGPRVNFMAHQSDGKFRFIDEWTITQNNTGKTVTCDVTTHFTEEEEPVLLRIGFSCPICSFDDVLHTLNNTEIEKIMAMIDRNFNFYVSHTEGADGMEALKEIFNMFPVIDSVDNNGVRHQFRKFEENIELFKGNWNSVNFWNLNQDFNEARLLIPNELYKHNFSEIQSSGSYTVDPAGSPDMLAVNSNWILTRRTKDPEYDKIRAVLKVVFNTTIPTAPSLSGLQFIPQLIPAPSDYL